MKKSKKYIEFYKFLEKSRKSRLKLTYEEIETIIEQPLPYSAYRYQAYFSNSFSHPISKIWLELGYKQVELKLGEYLVLEIE